MRDTYGTITADRAPVRIFDIKTDPRGTSKVLTVRGRLIQGAPRIPFRIGPPGCIAPAEIEVQYWPDSGSPTVACVAVGGRRIERDGHPGRIHCKVVFWTDTLSDAPAWVQEFVVAHRPDHRPVVIR